MSDKNKSKEQEKKNEEDPTKKKDTKKKTGADEDDIEILKKYGKGPYSEKIKSIEDEVKDLTS